VPLDFTFVLWVGSLLLSAAAVVVFLWLMRGDRESGIGNRESGEVEKSPGKTDL
jgi:hypothetical protein